MEVIKSPEKVPKFLNTIFLAGSIEMGKAEDWQSRVTSELKDCDVVLLNPRRDNWDPTWEQSINNAKFLEQVTWELDNIQSASGVIFYFAPGTYSPISLMELGVVSSDPVNVFVCCPTGFWRKGNVDILCSRVGIPVFETIEETISALKGIL